MSRPPLKSVEAAGEPRPVPADLIVALSDAAMRAVALGATSFIIGMQASDEEMTVISFPPAKAARQGMAGELLSVVTPGEWVDPDDL